MKLQAQDHLETLFRLEGHRILSTREPNPSRGPGFVFVRRADSYAWAVGSGMGEEVAKELAALVLDEVATSDFRQAPTHLTKYLEIIGGGFDFGPAFEFPDDLPSTGEVVLIEEIGQLGTLFKGWTVDELLGRAPMVAVMEGGVPVSLCFSSRVSELAAEAGLETALEFRGRGLAGKATTAWAAAVRASGRTPIYSTSFRNDASVAVARKLGLIECASYWNLFTKQASG